MPISARKRRRDATPLRDSARACHNAAHYKAGCGAVNIGICAGHHLNHAVGSCDCQSGVFIHSTDIGHCHRRIVGSVNCNGQRRYCNIPILVGNLVSESIGE